MYFSLDILFELIPEYQFEIVDDSFLSNQYKAIHLLPVESEHLNPQMVYMTDSYDMERYRNFCSAQSKGRQDCLIYIYESDEQYVAGASIYLKTEIEMAVILNRMQEILIDLIVLERNLVEAVMQELPLESMVDSIHSVIRNPLAVLDPSQKLLAHREDSALEDRCFSELLNHGYLSEATIYKMSELHYFEADSVNAPPIELCHPDELSEYTRIFYRMDIAPSTAATLYCVVKNQRYKGSIEAMLRLFAPHILQKMIQDYSRSKYYQCESLFTDLLEQSVQSEAEIKSRALALGIPYRADYLLLCTDVIDQGIPTDSFLEQVCVHLPSAQSLIWNNRAIVLFRGVQDADAVIRRLAPLFTRNRLNAGLSCPVQSLNDVYLAFTQAAFAKEVSMRLETNHFIQEFGLPVILQRGPIYRYQDVSVYHAYDLAIHQIDWHSLCEARLLQMIDSARKTHSCALQVLYTYLTCGCSYVATAQTLHMHRNNVVYHIKRLKEEGLDLDDCLSRHRLLGTFFILFLL